MDAIKHLKGHLNFYLKEGKTQANTILLQKTPKPAPETNHSTFMLQNEQQW